MLVHSYKVLLAKHEASYCTLKAAFILTQDPKVKERLEQTQKEIDWIKQRIADGKDPGCYVQ